MYKASMFICISLIFIILPILLKASQSINSLTKRQLAGPFGGGPFTFVMTPLEPMCECQLDNTNFTNYKGASVQLLRDLIKRLEWTESDYIVTCKTWDDMFDYVKENNNSLAISGITITNPRILLGYQFSFPTFQAPFSMLVRDESYQMLFLRPLTIQFALILLSTIIILALFVKVTEGEGSYLDFFYQQVANLFISGDEASTFGGRMICIMFWILGLVLTEMYISHIAEFMINQADELETANDLVNKHVLSMTPAVNILLSCSAYTQEFLGGLGHKALHKLLTLEEYSGYAGAVSDDHIVYLASLIYCDVHRELTNFFMANLGMMFGPDTLQSTIEFFNQQLVRVLESHQSYLWTYIEDEYEDQKCENNLRVEQLDVNHLAELFYIALAIVGVGTIGYLVLRIYKQRKAKGERKVAEVSSPDKEDRDRDRDNGYGSRSTTKPNAATSILPIIDHDLSRNEMSTIALTKLAFRGNPETIENKIVHTENEIYLNRIDFNGENYKSTVSEINHKFEERINEIVCSNLDKFQNSLEMKIEPIWDLLFEISDESVSWSNPEPREFTSKNSSPYGSNQEHKLVRKNRLPELNFKPKWGAFAIYSPTQGKNVLRASVKWSGILDQNYSSTGGSPRSAFPMNRSPNSEVEETHFHIINGKGSYYSTPMTMKVNHIPDNEETIDNTTRYHKKYKMINP